MCVQQRLRPACAYAQSDQSLYYFLEYSMTLRPLTKYHLEFLSLQGGCTGSSESTLVKYHIVGNHMSLLIFRPATHQNLILYMGLIVRKPVFEVCEQQRRRPACAFPRSDQGLCFSLFGKPHIQTCFKWNFHFHETPKTGFLATRPIGASTWENLSSGFANSEGADRPGHPHSLISAFCYSLFLESFISKIAISEISIL